MSQIQIAHANDTKQLRDGVVNMVNVGADNLAIEPGESTAAAGRAAFEALEAATAAVAAGEVEGLVPATLYKRVSVARRTRRRRSQIQTSRS